MYIETHNLNFSYKKGISGENSALRNVTLSVERGSWTAVVGPTGSGKTTFVQHLNGLLKPSSGQVYVNGQNINEKGYSMTKLRRNVGLVFQYPEHQLFEAAVFNEVAFGPRNLGIPEEKVSEVVSWAMERVGLDFEAFKERVPLELSGGEKRKVAIAGVLAMQPQVIIFDEATAGLDPVGRCRLLEEVSHLQKDLGLTIIWVTHNLNEVLEYAEWMVVFHNGSVAIQGKPEEVFARVDFLMEINLGVPQLFELQHKLELRGLTFKRRFLNLTEANRSILEATGGVT